MTRARVVKAAMDRINSRKPSHRRCVCANCQGDIEREINHAFDEGRIAGMREAAGVHLEKVDQLKAMTESEEIDPHGLGVDTVRNAIRREARALARKVRG